MKTSKSISILKILKRILPIAFYASPIYLTFTLIVAVLHGFSNGLITIFTQNLFDNVASSVDSKNIYSILISISLLAFVLILNYVLNGFHNVMSEDMSNRIMRQMGSALHKKASRLDTLLFEDASNLDNITKAKKGVMSSAFFLFIFFMIFTYYLPYLVIMIIYLYRLKPILSFSLLLIFLPVALNQFIKVKYFSKLADESASLEREYNFYENYMTDNEFYKETKILGAHKYFLNLYIKTLKIYNYKYWKVEKKSGFLELKMKLITLIGYIGVLLLFVNALLSKEISIGAFFAVFTSIDMMFKILEELITSYIGRLSRNLGNIRNFINFLDLPETSGDMKLNDANYEITLKNVSFKYPNSDKNVLENINLNILPGETIAIVGDNGAGKSTLVKLIVGLYLPTNGIVEYGEINSLYVDKYSLYSNISAVFQNFQKYKFNLLQNISISDSNGFINCDYSLVEESIKISNLNLFKFPDKYETILSREFGGIDISGGEWQKLAIARGIYKKHNIIILDEPTASIDPNEETKLYNTFLDVSKNKTSLIVTHRLGLTKYVDKIIVLENGKIIEIGNHEQLMKNNQKYAKMFSVQSNIYK